MDSYLNQILQLDIRFSSEPMLDSWPYLFERKYVLHKAIVENYCFYVVEPRIKVPLRQIVLDFKQIKESFSEPCCILFQDTQPTQYMRQSLIRQRIPYWIQGKDIYLPFLGIVLARLKRKSPMNRKISKLTFAAQRFLFQVIYNKIKQCTASSASREFGLSIMTYSRIFDELKEFDRTMIDDNNGRRKFVYQKSPKSLWKKIRPFLQSPVVRTYALADWRKKNCSLAGISALSQYSMLGDDDIPTYAITIREEREFGLPKRYTLVPDDEIPKQQIWVLSYRIPYHDSYELMDPLSLAAALYSMPEHVDDSRVEMAIDEMLERYAFS